jgi:hypothetical protein
LKQKRRRQTQLARWRDKQEAKPVEAASAAPVKAPSKA